MSSPWGTIRRGGFLVAATAISTLLRVVFVVLAGRLFGPEPYAEFYAALSLLFLLGTGVAPVASAIARLSSLHASREEMDKVVALKRAISWRVPGYSTLLPLVGLAVSIPLRSLLGFESVSTLILIFVALALTLLLGSPRGLLRGLQEFRAYGLNLILESSVRLLVAAPLFLLWSPSVASGLSAYILGSVIAFLAGQWQTASVGTGIEPSAKVSFALERMIGPLFVFAFASATYQNFDMLFVNRQFAAADAGVYAAAASLARLPALAFLPFSIVLLPVFTATFARGGSLLGPLLRYGATYLALAGGATAILGVWGRPIVFALYGEAFGAAHRWLFPLALALTLTFLSAIVGQAYCAADRYGFLLPFLGGLVVEMAALRSWGNSVENVPWVLLAVQSANLALMLLFLLVRPPQRSTR